MLKRGGGTKSFGEFFYAVALSFSHIEGEGAQKVSTLLNGGAGEKFYPVLRGAQKISGPRFSHFVALPSPLLMISPLD